MIKVKYNEDIKEKYYSILSQLKFQKSNNNTLEEIYNEKYKDEFGYELRDVLCGDFESLQGIKEKIKDRNDDELKKLFNYQNKFQPQIAKFFEENVQVHTCYFCNIDFINTYNTNKKKKNNFTLDHFIDKGTYPYLALSLYNLVPSCYVCNSKVKGTHEIKSLSPTSQNFDFDDKVKFKTFLKNKDLQIDKKNDFELLLKEDYSDKFNHYMDTLLLNERYEYHKYKALEMIEKRRDYPDSRIKELAQLIKKTQEEVKQDLFGMYLNDDFHKRPLSKLIKDISEELGLV